MKRCPKCGELKELSDFNKKTKSNDGHTSYCRVCSNEHSLKYGWEVKGKISMSENKECPCYLGVAVAERLCRHLFKDVIRMPNNNPGYDFICTKDKKIDVKSACMSMNHKKNQYWKFTTNNNKIADYFLLLAFNNRQDLEPQHQWLIPANVINNQGMVTISLSTITKWDEYRQPIGPAIACCNTIKEI